MFYYLSQFLSFLVMPLTIAFVILAVGLFLPNRRTGRKWLIGGFLLLIFFSNDFIANYAMHLWEPDFKEMASLPEHEFGIVLTGVTNLKKTAYDRTFFNKGADRVTHAVQLYKMGKIHKILVTGGQGLNPTNPNREADLLADFMAIAGVPKEDILIENEAVNTRQNALFAKETLIQAEADLEATYLLITSAFHMKRSKGCFDKVGITTTTFPVDYYAYDPTVTFKSLVQPNPAALVNWHLLFKEWVGLTAYRVAGYI